MKQNILKLTTAALVVLFATSAHATWTKEQYDALLSAGADDDFYQKVGTGIVTAGGVAQFEADLGTGDLSAIKTKLGVVGGTSIGDDLTAQVARIEAGAATTLKGAIDDTKALVNLTPAVVGNSVLQDIQAEIGIADTASGGGPSADLHAAIGTLAAAVGGGAIPGATLDKIQAGTTAVNIDARLDAELDRLNNPRPASIDVALTAAEVLVPVNGSTLVQNLGTIKGTIDGGAAATLPLVVTAAAGKIGAGATIPLAITDAIAKINAGSADIPAAIAAAAPKINGGSADIPAAIAAAAPKIGAGATIPLAITDAAGKIGVGADIPAATAAARTILINRLNAGSTAGALTLAAPLTLTGAVPDQVDAADATNTVARLLTFLNGKNITD
ncbi:MAG: hypothetical protein ACTHJ4_04545 [Candidatus Nucleicultricaceae bacterium]